MNKQELIEKHEGKLNIKLNLQLLHIYKEFIRDLMQLDEPEKVKVPQFVAEKIDYFKKTGDWDLFQAMDYLFGKKEIREWLEDKNNQDTFARAWLDGYDIQGTKYVVTDGNHLYFKNYQEDIEIVILVDEQPGTMEYVKKFNTKEEAQKAADILGWKVREVEE
jgi:hypothetical protein|nr:MAG TPA: Protein of unknown function (DUF1642) [Caudoviricetes sp.]